MGQASKEAQDTVLSGLSDHGKKYEDALGYWTSFKRGVEDQLRSESFCIFSDNGIRDSFNINMFGHVFKMFFIFRPEHSRIRHTKQVGTQFNPKLEQFGGDIVFKSENGKIKDAEKVEINSPEGVLVHLRKLKEEIEKDQ